MAATWKVHKWPNRNVCIRLVNDLHEQYQTLWSVSMSNRAVNFAGEQCAYWEFCGMHSRQNGTSCRDGKTIVVFSLLFRSEEEEEEEEKGPSFSRLHMHLIAGEFHCFHILSIHLWCQILIYLYYLMGEEAIWLDFAWVCGCIFTSRRRVQI